MFHLPRNSIRWPRLLPGLALAAFLAACSEEAAPPGPPAQPAPDEVVLRVGDYAFTEAELNEFVAFVQSLDRQIAPAYIRRVHLQEHLLPSRIARDKADPFRVADAERRASGIEEALAAAGGDVGALMRLGEPLGGQEAEEFLAPLPRLPVDLACAAWRAPVGGCTDVIATIYGFAVVGVLEERDRPSPWTGTERRLYTVFFPLSQDETFRPEVLRERDRLLGEVRYVHPAYRDEFAVSPPSSR